MKVIMLATVVALGAAVMESASADILQVEVFMDGLQEVPPNASPGFGSAMVTFNTDTNLLTVDGTFSGLIGTYTVAHVHGPAMPGQNGAAFITLNLSGPGTSGAVEGSGILTAAQVQWLFDDLLYINVHTTFFPGGEIRGQIMNIPSPGALAFFGLMTLTGSRRRRR